MTADLNNTPGHGQGEGQTAYGRAKDLFLRLMEMPFAEREAHLAEFCRDDSDLENQVRRLLDQHDQNEQQVAPAGSALPPKLGPFVPTRLLGEGGTGAVYLAYHENINTPVALKVLHPGMLARESHRRFHREGEVLARLDHPGIANLLATGEETTPHGPVYFLATEFVDGLHLNRYLDSAELSLDEKLQLMLGICEAVAHAHQEGVVHRDLKPANILVTTDEQPHVLDFGVARLVGSTSGEMTAVTETGQLIGTLKYMSPEQAKGDETGTQTDVYSLGLILHELLTGRMPYEVPQTAIHQSLAAILTAEPTWPSDHDPALGSDLDAITARCLARNPENRYSDAQELAADLTAHLAGKTISAPAPKRRKAKSRPPWLLLGILLGAVLGLLWWQPWRADSRIDDHDLGPVLGQLDRADQEMHFKQHTLEGLNRAVAILDSAQVQLHDLPSSDNKTALMRYASSRLGEAHYFLGSRLFSPAEYELALRSYEAANHPMFQPEELADLPLEAPVTSRARRRGRHHPSLGQALAYSALAEHQRPRFNLEQAVFLCDEARKLQEDLRGPNYWQPFDEHVRQEDRAIVLNDFARSLTLLAAVCDSLPLVERALLLFAEADTSTALQPNLSAYGSLLRGRARGYLTRAELTRSAADLDTARYYLGRCLGLGESGVTARFRTNLMLSEWALLETERLPGGAGNYSKISGLTGRARKILEGEENAVAPNLLARLLQIEAATSWAASPHDSRMLDRADSLLALAEAVLPAERFSTLRTWILLDRSQVAFASYMLTGDSEDRRLADSFLDQGLPFADMAFHPRLSRLYSEARHRYKISQENNE